jgi:hypothetical protein
MSIVNNPFHLFVLKNFTIKNTKKIDERITLIPRNNFVIASIKQINSLSSIPSEQVKLSSESYDIMKNTGKYFFEPLEYLKRFLSLYQISNDDTIENFDLKINLPGVLLSNFKFNMKTMPIISNIYPIMHHNESEILNLEKIRVRDGMDFDQWIVEVDNMRMSSSDISWTMCDTFDESSFQKYYEFSQKTQSILNRSGILIDDIKTKQALKNILLVYQNAKEGNDYATSIPIFIRILETLFTTDNKIGKSLKKRISVIFSEFIDDIDSILDGYYSFRSDIVHLNQKLQFSQNQVEFNHIKRYIASMCSILIRYFIDKLYDNEHYTIKKFRNSIIADSDFWGDGYYEAKCSNCTMEFFQKNKLSCTRCKTSCILKENKFQCLKCNFTRYHKCINCRYKYSSNWYDEIKSKNTNIKTDI